MVESKGVRIRSSVRIDKVRISDIDFIAIDSSKVMTQGDIDIVADSIADFLLQNYLKEKERTN